MNKIIVLLLSIIGFVSCHSSVQENSRTNVKEALDKNGLNIDSKIIFSIEKDLDKNSEPFKREVWTFDRDGAENNYTLDTGIIFKFINEIQARTVFKKNYNKVKKTGNTIFLTNLDFDDSYNSYFDLVIINESDPFKIIDLIGTNGLNYDVYTNDVVKKLKEWDDNVGLRIEVIDVSRIHAYINRLPSDLPKFTADVYAFCPDVIDQGYGSMEEMITDYKQSKHLWLWWD